ncbi:hypothetical protein L249_7771 [Ophiocordyceps polyrhachis-furcata BCC 54312]|uniref:Signal recognition particle subunit SRP54 n=2 Tax=Hypocreales TaxID=5125 RepID=A0A367LA67_9HYPO|nr:hypothetical protein L249_7771 [Ophiocordyceps polyrhachis-furcata BCC 54312]
MATPSTPVRRYAVIPSGSATQLSRSVKRMISPSSTQSPSQKSILLVASDESPHQPGQQLDIGTYFPPRQLFPNNQAEVSPEPATWHTANVLVPFNMRDLQVSLEEGEPMRILHSIFPQTIHVMESVPRRWLNFYVRQLPSTPWPVAVGGLPITICTNTQGRGPFFPAKRRQGNLGISLFQDLNGRAEDYFSLEDFRSLAATVHRYFLAHHENVKLCEIITTMQNEIVVVLDGDGFAINLLAPKLPGKIAKCFVGYLHESELHRPLSRSDSRARRIIRPDHFSRVSDNTAYDVIRPGVMLWSDRLLTHAHPFTMTTTAGVLIQSRNDQMFLTGASHGFGDDRVVYQLRADNSKRIIGEAIHEITHTDVALVKLRDDVSAENVTFEDQNGNVPTFVRLLGEKASDLSPKSKYPEMVFLNSPFSGVVEGITVARSIKIESENAAEQRVRFVPYSWSFTGQVEDAGDCVRAPPEGVCGSALWDDEGVVRGFFQYFIAEGRYAGFSVSADASELVEAGYRLAQYFVRRWQYVYPTPVAFTDVPRPRSSRTPSSGETSEHLSGFHVQSSSHLSSREVDGLLVMVLQDLGRRINAAVTNLTREQNLDEKALDSMLKEICAALLEADVNVRLVGQLRKSIKSSVNFKELPPAVNKKRIIQKAVMDELVNLVDPHVDPFKPKKGRPNVIMFVGLQGAGKTTTCTKLARHYQARGLRACLVCADTFRAGAFDQLKQNATKAKIPYYGSLTETDPAAVARAGVEQFKKDKFDVIIVDTSGRHRQEAALFREMVDIQHAVRPDETIMVLDASIGQQAEAQAKAFKEAADFGSIIITKTDGHAHGGGAISAVAATRTPIVFIGTGEHMLDLERFAPRQFVQKLLGMGDMAGLVEHVQSLNLDQKDTIKHLQEGIFTVRDLRDQLSNIMKMGPLSKMAGMIPGMGNIMQGMDDEEGGAKLKRMIYICDSMTDKELDSDGKLLAEQPTRMTRIARGSGTSVREVEDLLTQQRMMAGMAKKMGGNMKNMQRAQQAMGGGNKAHSWPRCRSGYRAWAAVEEEDQAEEDWEEGVCRTWAP